MLDPIPASRHVSEGLETTEGSSTMHRAPSSHYGFGVAERGIFDA